MCRISSVEMEQTILETSQLSLEGAASAEAAQLAQGHLPLRGLSCQHCYCRAPHHYKYEL